MMGTSNNVNDTCSLSPAHDVCCLPYTGSGRCTLFLNNSPGEDTNTYDRTLCTPGNVILIQRGNNQLEEEEEVVLCSSTFLNHNNNSHGANTSSAVLYHDDSTTYPLIRVIGTTSLEQALLCSSSSIVLQCCSISSNHSNSSNNVDDAKLCKVYHYPADFVSTLLSIILIEEESSANNNSSSSNSALLSSCIKRCLIGRIIIIDCITRVHVNNFIFKYKVAQLTPKQQHQHQQYDTTTTTSHFDQMFRILPSTIITILVNKDKKKKEEKEQQLTTPTRHSSITTTELLSNKNKVLQQQKHQLPNTNNSINQNKSNRRSFCYNPHSILLEYMIALRKSIAITSNIDVPRSFLLTGPQGVGKTFSVQTCFNTFKKQQEEECYLFSIRGSDILFSSSHQTSLHAYFQNAARLASKTPKSISIIFLDECDALMDETTTTAAAQLGYLLDCISSSSGSNTAFIRSNANESSKTQQEEAWNRVIVIAATNRIETIPDWLRRRLDREILVTPPNIKERYDMLQRMLSSSCCCFSDTELHKIAEECVGYVAADLAALVRKAILLANSRSTTEPKDLVRITFHHLILAKEDVGASALRDSAISAPPKTSWDDIAGNAGGAKEALRRAVEWPRTKSVAFRQLGLTSPRGVLLYGPPGCAKTSLARAAAGSAGIAFISLSPAEVFASSYVGEAEGTIRRVFALARSVAPCILFFDEIDAIIGTSSSNMSRESSSSSEARVLSTFLNEMDGVDSSPLDGVLCLGATNRPTVLDAALLRPGRFDRVIYVPPPDWDARRTLFSLQLAVALTGSRAAKSCSSCQEQTAIDVDYLASDAVSGRLTGAEIVGACQEALMLAMREVLEESTTRENYDSTIACYAEPVLTQRHLNQVLQSLKPMLTDQMLAEYKEFEQKSL